MQFSKQRETRISGGPLDQDRLRQLGEMCVIMGDRQHGATNENRECDN
jgi:hypothetical protein